MAVTDVALEEVCSNHRSAYVCQSTDPSECETLGVCGVLAPCRDGFQHETMMFRFANCAQPVVIVPIIAGIIIFLGVVAQVLLVRRFRQKTHRDSALVVLIGAQFTNVGMVAMSISLWVQGYSSPAFWFFIGVAASAISVSLTTTITAFARIVYKLAAIPFPAKTFRLVFVCSVGTLSFPFWCILFPASFVSDPVTYNTMLASGVLLVPLQLVVTAPILFVATTRLEKNIKDIIQNNASMLENPAASNEKLVNLLSRIALFRTSMKIIVPVEVGFLVLISLMYFIWRVPFMSWIMLGVLELVVASCVYVFIFVSVEGKGGSSSASAKARAGQNSSSKDSSTAVNANNNNKRVKSPRNHSSLQAGARQVVASPSGDSSSEDRVAPFSAAAESAVGSMPVLSASD